MARAGWVVEIDADALRWRGGWRRRDRVVRRAGVVEARRVDVGRGIEQLRFHDAAGERVGLLPLFPFDRGRVLTALRRHGWPDPVEWR